MKNFYFLILVTFLLATTSLFAQKGTVVGTVTDNYGPVPGTTVLVFGSTIGTITDSDGNYTLSLDPGNYTLRVSIIGYGSLSKDVTVSSDQEIRADFILTEGIGLDEVVMDEVVAIGSRAIGRTKLETPVPVDVIKLARMSNVVPQTELNQLLNQTVPSFSSNTQTISDGTDHIDPASLRGLGPDQVLVLVNGKRRHSTSLVNVNGTFGRGNVGTDLNAIPATALENIEVLRDGAAAQYGSDAIAGVINLRLKDDVNKLKISLTTGANFTSGIGPFAGELPDIDGEKVDLGINYGLSLGKSGGFINMSGEFNFRDWSNRMQEFRGEIFNGLNSVENVALNGGANIAALDSNDIKHYAQSVSYFSDELKSKIMNAPDVDSLATLLDFDATEDELIARGMQRSDFNMRVGQSAIRGGKFFANLSVPLQNNYELYSFGGLSYRNGNSGCFYRLPNQQRTTTSVYPNGTVPNINSNIVDRSIGVGLSGKVGNWNIDLSNVYGYNEFQFHMTETHNATLGSSTPTEFDAGGHEFAQNTANLDISQYFDSPGSFSGMNVAFGAEYRFENFGISPGTELSYGNYDVNGNLVNPVTPDSLYTVDFFGRNRPSGCQCFAGFLPSNDVDANRSSIAGYGDVEIDFTDALLLGSAIRFENYSDFGSTFNYKFAGRYKLADHFAIRGAASTGFRAPSLHQIHFSRTSTIFELVGGVSIAQERGTFANTSRAAKLLGIPELKEETSQNFSFGLTGSIPGANLRVTADVYAINIDDRIVLTGQFSPGDVEDSLEQAEMEAIFEQAGATRASFFANAIDTRSLGFDVVLTHNVSFNEDARLRSDLAATFSKTEQDGDIKASDRLRNAGLVNTYFDQTSKIYLERAVPRIKLSLSNTLDMYGFNVYLRNTYFGETTEATNEELFDENLDPLSGIEVEPVYDGKIVTDISIGRNLTENLNLTIGANNLLDVYPDESDELFQSSGRFIYSRRSPQFSYNGRFLFARLGFTLR